MPDLFAADSGMLSHLEAELPDGLNATLLEVVTSLFLALAEDAELVEKLGYPRLAELSVAQLDRVSQDVGGASFYFPKGISCKLSPRDRDIGERYTGRNKHQLAREFGISDMRVDQIYKKWRQAEISRRQGILNLDSAA